MKVRVWDTYVERTDGNTMHFDILAPEEITDTKTIFAYGRKYLETKGEGNQSLSSNECVFCHIEKANPEVEQSIDAKGYYIIEMQNCY